LLITQADDGIREKRLHDDFLVKFNLPPKLSKAPKRRKAKKTSRNGAHKKKASKEERDGEKIMCN
jgi:hypothetical protein